MEQTTMPMVVYHNRKNTYYLTFPKNDTKDKVPKEESGKISITKHLLYQKLISEA